MDFISSSIPTFGLESVPRWYIGAILFSGYIVYYFCEVVKVPQFVCSKGCFRNFLEENVPILKEKFWPSIWCVESRAQTVLANLLRDRLVNRVKYRREVLELADGGEVALDWLEEGCSAEAPLVLILPGLTGSSQAEYIRCMVTAANRSGLRTVVFNNRGLGGLALKTPRFYNACNSEDLSAVINYVKKKNPNTPLAAAGVSMGGLVLGNYIARMGKSVRNQLVASMLISVPWNIFKATENIEKPGLNMMLNKYLADSLYQAVKRQTHIRWDHVDGELKSRTIREFDSKFTCKAFGYSNTNEYYTDATLHDKLHKIQIPTLCLSAADDPFQPLEAIPLEEFSSCKNVAVVITARGGHIGFMEGLLPPSCHGKDEYIDRIFCQFFSAIFKHGRQIIEKIDSQLL